MPPMLKTVGFTGRAVWTLCTCAAPAKQGASTDRLTVQTWGRTKTERGAPSITFDRIFGPNARSANRELMNPWSALGLVGGQGSIEHSTQGFSVLRE